MIKTKEDLRAVISIDFDRYPKSKMPFIIRWITKDESTRIKHYLWVLRHTEYHINNRHFVKYIWMLWHKRLSNILGLYIHCNCCDSGLRINHIAGGVYLNALRIGKNFTATTGVVIGKGDNDDARPIIGDNVYFTIGSKAYGRIKIGNNVIVAPNSVIFKDVEDNVVLSGIPAQVINRKAII